MGCFYHLPMPKHSSYAKVYKNYVGLETKYRTDEDRSHFMLCFMLSFCYVNCQAMNGLS